MIKVWVLTLVFISGGGNSVSTQQYQFATQNECLKANEYAIKNAGYARTGFCLLAEKP